MRIMWSSIIENDRCTVFVYDAVKNFVKKKKNCLKTQPLHLHRSRLIRFK